MRSYIYSIISIVSVLSFSFLSCTNDKVEITAQYEFTVNPSNVLSVITPYNQSGTDMIDGSELRMTALFYDESGNLFDKQETTLEDYSKIWQFSHVGFDPDKKYKMIVISGAILESLEAFTITGEKSLSTLTVEQNYITTNYYSNFTLLGLAEANLSSDSYSYSLALKASSSLVAIRYKNVHAKDNINVDTYQFHFHSNDIATYSTSFNYSSSLSSNYSYYNSIDMTDEDFSESVNIYDMIYCFPSQSMKYSASYHIGDYRSDFGENSCKIEAGKTYLFEIDCSSEIVTLQTYTKANLPVSESVKEKCQPIQNVFNNQNAKVIDLLCN